MAPFWQRAAVATTALFSSALALLAAPPAPPAAPAALVTLTDEEQNWIREHPRIRVIALGDYAPYLISEPDGQLAGLSVNLIDLIAKRTGLKFEYQKYSSVSAAIGAFKSGEGDVLPALARSPEREQFALFSQPYATAFAVLVTRTDSPYLNSLQDLAGLRVGCLRGAVQNRLIAEAAPDARLIEYTTAQESLVALAAGKVDATYASVGTAAYYIKHLQLSNLRLGSVMGNSMELHVGVRKDWPVLAGIIDKALASVTPTERKKLDDQWIFVAQAPNRWLPWLRFAAIVAVVAIAVASLLLYFYRRLARELAERKRILLELEETHRALARVSEEKSEMMSSIAHDLRNPITGLMLGSELLKTIVDPANQEAHEVLASQRDTCRKMISRVEELVHPHILETGRRELKWTQLDLVAVVRESIAELAEAAGAKGITFNLRAESPVMLFVSDKVALQHVTDNLLSNALKYSPRQSAVRIEILREDGGYVLHVADQGPGVRPEERETIFQRFTRGSAQPTAGEKSTGLGLWIVRRTLADLHGRVWCGPGRGTSGATFSAFVPLAPPAHEHPAR